MFDSLAIAKLLTGCFWCEQMSIRKIAEQSIANGFLTVAEENHLRQLLQNSYEKEDLQAFMSLQKAAMKGLVKQESREIRRGKERE